MPAYPKGGRCYRRYRYRVFVGIATVLSSVSLPCFRRYHFREFVGIATVLSSVSLALFRRYRYRAIVGIVPLYVGRQRVSERMKALCQVAFIWDKKKNWGCALTQPRALLYYSIIGLYCAGSGAWTSTLQR